MKAVFAILFPVLLPMSALAAAGGGGQVGSDTAQASLVQQYDQQQQAKLSRDPVHGIHGCETQVDICKEGLKALGLKPSQVLEAQAGDSRQDLKEQMAAQGVFINPAMADYYGAQYTYFKLKSGSIAKWVEPKAYVISEGN